MKRSEAFPSNYLSKEDVQTPVIATIESLARKTLKSDEGDETKTLMYFREDQLKPLILNNTNWLICEDAYGEDSDSWIGRKIELYFEPNVMFGAKRTGGVRVRVPHASSVPSTLTLEQAVALCESVGLSKELLVADLKAAGKTGYIASRDTEQVLLLVEDKKAQDASKEIAF
jgi:hypothetical protein